MQYKESIQPLKLGQYEEQHLNTTKQKHTSDGSTFKIGQRLAPFLKKHTCVKNVIILVRQVKLAIEFLNEILFAIKRGCHAHKYQLMNIQGMTESCPCYTQQISESLYFISPTLTHLGPKNTLTECMHT